MKNLTYSLFTLFIVFMLSACGGGTESGNAAQSTDPAVVKTALKEKKDALQKLKAEINELEAHLAKIDTSAKRDERTEITTRKVRVKDFAHYVEVQGNVATAQEPGFASSETGGRIVQLLTKEDAFVKKGDLIAKVDLESIRKSIAEIETSLNLSKDMFERQEKLWKQNIGSEVQYLQAKSQVEQLQKTKERLEFELNKASVYAPMSGFIEKVMVKEGEICGPGTPIVQIVNTSALKVVAQVPEIYLGKVKRGEKVEVSFPALDEKQMATIIEMGRMINPNNRTFEIEVAINTKNGLIKPNLMASVSIKDIDKPKSVVVYDELIMQDVEGNNYVMILVDGKAKKQVVKLGTSYNNETTIESGLTGEETIIVKGARQVVNGDEVKAIEEATAEVR